MKANPKIAAIMAMPMMSKISYFMFSSFSKSESPRQETTVGQREKRSRVLTKPPSSCARAPVLLPRTVYGSRTHDFQWCDSQSRFEPTHAQDCSGELQERLLA